MNVLGIVISLFILSNIVAVLGARECYQCSTTKDPDCALLMEPSDVDKCQTITNDEINCIMYEYVSRGKQIIYRGCRTKTDTCADIRRILIAENKEFVGCGICEGDLCLAEATPLID